MRAPNMQSLTNDIKKLHPGVVIYGVGDDAHKTRISDHNEDDTPGVRAEQSDADNIPEHRAIDVMLGEHFSEDQATDLVNRLMNDPSAKLRLRYVIWNGRIWSAKNGWGSDVYDGEDKHRTHVHISGLAADDANDSPWPTVFKSAHNDDAPSKVERLAVDGQLGPKTIKRWQQVMGTEVDGVISTPDSQLIRAVQRRLKGTVNSNLQIDGDMGYKTIAALQKYLGSPVDGHISTPRSQVVVALQRRLNEGRF